MARTLVIIRYQDFAHAPLKGESRWQRGRKVLRRALFAVNWVAPWSVWARWRARRQDLRGDPKKRYSQMPLDEKEGSVTKSLLEVMPTVFSVHGEMAMSRFLIDNTDWRENALEVLKDIAEAVAREERDNPDFGTSKARGDIVANGLAVALSCGVFSDHVLPAARRWLVSAPEDLQCTFTELFTAFGLASDRSVMTKAALKSAIHAVAVSSPENDREDLWSKNFDPLLKVKPSFDLAPPALIDTLLTLHKVYFLLSKLPIPGPPPSQRTREMDVLHL